jgi:DTW domain-containing protein YfiP
MSTPANRRRPTCANCQRPQAACICAAVVHVDSQVELLVLLHPMEASNAKNSGRLLNLCLPGSRLVVGEAFDTPDLEALLYDGGREPVLLYPQTKGDESLGIAAPPAPDPGLLASPGRLRLVVLDATWRKSRKMLYLNPALQRLPRMALDDVPASGYRIRKAHAPHQLSTLEAAAYALAQLEGQDEGCARLLAAFERFVAHQAALARRA